MWCQLCDPSKGDRNVCEQCAYTLRPMQEWFADQMQDDGWLTDDALLNEFVGPEIRLVNSFLAGARLSYKVDEDKGFGRKVGYLRAIQHPIFNYCLPKEVGQDND